MAYEQIAVRRDGSVVTITLNRPDKLNAMTGVMSDELLEVFTSVRDDDDARAIVVTGAGRGFCAGQDLTEFESAYRAGERPDIREHLEQSYHRLIPVVVSTPKPVIAAVNGVAAGAGVSLAAACDIRIAAEEARFTQAFVKIGLIPDSGGTWLLPRIIGYARALELSITGEVIDAETALEIGLVNRVVDGDALEDEVSGLAARLAAMPTAAIGETKALLRGAALLDLEAALHAEAEAQARMGQTDDHLEGVVAFAEKREPRFRGR
jgi:2-(1,2-epoxy-1,2-dihydrophenyl)acetyl-CoA isomerase